MALPDEIELAAKTGYKAIEPWLEKIHGYAKGGGSLKDISKRIADLGLTVESAIGFAQFIVDDLFPERTEDEMYFVLSAVDLIQQSLQVNRAACPGAGDNEFHEEAVGYQCQLSVGKEASAFDGSQI